MSKNKFSLVVLVLISVVAIADGGRPQREANYDYVPIHDEFWKRINGLLNANNSHDIYALAPTSKTSAPDWDEYRLAIAKALIKDKAFLHAEYLLAAIASKSLGTSQGLEALHLIYEIGLTEPLDEATMEDLSFDLDAKIEDPEVQAMVAYYRGRMLIRKGYDKWALQSLGEVGAQTSWGQEVAYDQAIQVLAKGDSAAAYEQFSAIAKSEHSRRPTSMMAELALARLVFERKDYASAIAIYHKLNLPVRERARALNEIAWNYFYNRSYGKALGAITALRSRYFSKLLAPETVVLEMLIYRELCHYKHIQVLADKFAQTFSPILKGITSRRSLDSIPELEQLILQEGVMQKRASIIQSLREERTHLKAAKEWNEKELHAWTLQQGQQHEQMVEAEVRRMFKDRLDGAANRVLDYNDQVRFLKYEASLRQLQIKESQSTDYTPPEKDRVKPNTMFWPVNEESWMDEIPDYEVLVTSLCRAEVKK